MKLIDENLSNDSNQLKLQQLVDVKNSNVRQVLLLDGASDGTNSQAGASSYKLKFQQKLNLRENVLDVSISDAFDGRELWTDTVDLAELLALSGRTVLLESELEISDQAEAAEEEEKNVTTETQAEGQDSIGNDTEQKKKQNEAENAEDVDEVDPASGDSSSSASDSAGTFDYGPYIENFPQWAAD